MEEDVGIPLLKGERKEIGGGSLTWEVFWLEVKVLGSVAGPMVAVSMSQYLLQIVCPMMVGHLGELSLASAALAIFLCSVTGFSPLEEGVGVGALSFPSGAVSEVLAEQNLVWIWVPPGSICFGDWWAGYGYEIPILQRAAIRILSQPCSSHWCRWNWNTFDAVVYTKKSNTGDLLFVHCNIWLQEIVKGMDGKHKPIFYDDVDAVQCGPPSPSHPLLSR